MDIENIDQVSEPELDDRRADAAALDLVKQLITLASGVLALSATFLEKLGPLSPISLLLLAAAWLALIVSVLGGIQTMSAIVKSRLKSDDEWSRGTARNFALASKYGFVTGITLFVVFAFLLLSDFKSQPESFGLMPSHYSRY